MGMTGQQKKEEEYARRLYSELVQVAAVAVSAMVDVAGNECYELAYNNVRGEVRRQLTKWGKQHHDPRAWMTILGEEFGEACKEALNWKHEAVREDYEKQLEDK